MTTLEKYSGSKTTVIKSKLNIVTNTLHDNQNIALHTNEKFIQLEENVKEIEPLGILHEKALKELKQKIWWRNCKSKTLCLLVLLAILLVIVLATACSREHCD